MFSPIRIVFMIVSMSLVLGFAGLRMASPPPAHAFGGGSDWRIDPALRLYGMLYEFANKTPMPDVDALMARAGLRGAPPAPQVGRTGHSDSDMGRSLSDLRERQTGVSSRMPSFSDMVDNMNTISLGTGAPRSGPPPAEARRIVVGQ